MTHNLPEGLTITRYGLEVTGYVLPSAKVEGRVSLRITSQTLNGTSNFNKFQQEKLPELIAEVERVLIAGMTSRKAFYAEIKKGVWEAIPQPENTNETEEKEENDENYSGTLRPMTEQELYGDDYEEIHQMDEEIRRRWQAEHPNELISF